MPSSIAYDPSLVLMSVVNQAALEHVEQIAQAQVPVNAAYDNLNALISSRRSLTMTKTELQNLGISTKNLDENIDALNEQIEDAASAYARAKIDAQSRITHLRGKIHSEHKYIGSPVDYARCQIKTLPIASDTININVQYFSFDSNSQDLATYNAQIASYISKTVDVLGTENSMKIGARASEQVNRQVKSHSIEGTLVLSISCTHKNASVLSPFVLHVDKGINVWNGQFPGQKLDPTNSSSMAKAAMEIQEDQQKFSIISGTTFGSSFVGIVHVLRTTNMAASESLEAVSASIQKAMDPGAWFAKAGSKLSAEAQVVAKVKNLLSQQNVLSHVTVLTTGVLPSIVASDNFDPQENMEAVAAMPNATASDQATMSSMTEMQSKDIQASLSAISEIEGSLNVNSMMTALDDYLKKAFEGESGIPINYYLKDIDKKMLAEMWLAKYYPGRYVDEVR